MLKSPLKIALLLGAAIFSHAVASAGELTLFSRDGFDGREMTLRATTPNLVESGFNDRASSMIVRSGRWEVCEHVGFEGRCVVFEQGEYPTLERFNDRISSVREIMPERGHGGGRHHGGRRGMIALFADRGLEGDARRLRRDADDFAEIDFNDSARSVQIMQGTWQLCSDAGYRGTCSIFAPGRYEDLGRGLRARVSSARMVDAEGGGGAGGGQRDGDVELFSSSGFSGERLVLREDTRDLTDFGFNDRADALIVHRGQWEFCKHADFGGRCVTFGPGRYERLGPMGNLISSVRRLR
ncbi:beta/gamma crystallin-related protein [Massilia sp. CCM 9210]|uniref:beta/gamma crystallin-related protein n=1 Tax=Massilia scottii TaxID=3057166 RepID=UPI002796DE31|nr:beta/gamma crystallin-related protein [Massilia sp. CCM 9210]MDQ1817914.1 beta/gamma crystallin-related protein [Massilia sp. CCM 9210]